VRASRVDATTENLVELRTGYQAGVIGGIVTLHAGYYAAHHGFGAPFEAKVATGLAEFVPRLASPRNQLWTAWVDDQLAGSVAIDGEDLGAGKAHLRWFITSDALRGQGAGRTLLTEALRFCDAQGFAQTELWTFAGLDAARHLYERFGFTLAEEWPGTQWGATVKEQRFMRPLPRTTPT